MRGGDAEDACVKDEAGEGNGKSRLRWQDDYGEYTWDCPAALIKRYAGLIAVWNRWKTFGLSEGRGWQDEPAFYIEICEMLEAEYQKVSRHGHAR